MPPYMSARLQRSLGLVLLVTLPLCVPAEAAKREEAGVVVESVTPRSAGATAGLQPVSPSLLLIEGERMATVLRLAVKQHYGIRAEKLAEVGLPPFRGLRRKAPETPQTPTPPSTEVAPPADTETTQTWLERFQHLRRMRSARHPLFFPTRSAAVAMSPMSRNVSRSCRNLLRHCNRGGRKEPRLLEGVVSTSPDIAATSRDGSAPSPHLGRLLLLEPQLPEMSPPHRLMDEDFRS